MKKILISSLFLVLALAVFSSAYANKVSCHSGWITADIRIVIRIMPNGKWLNQGDEIKYRSINLKRVNDIIYSGKNRSLMIMDDFVYEIKGVDPGFIQKCFGKIK